MKLRGFLTGANALIKLHNFASKLLGLLRMNWNPVRNNFPKIQMIIDKIMRDDLTTRPSEKTAVMLLNSLNE